MPEEELEDIKQKRSFDIFHCIMPEYRLEDIFEMEHYQLVKALAALFAVDYPVSGVL